VPHKEWGVYRRGRLVSGRASMTFTEALMWTESAARAGKYDAGELRIDKIGERRQLALPFMTMGQKGRG
jgi:hypothetical protein